MVTETFVPGEDPDCTITIDLAVSLISNIPKRINRTHTLLQGRSLKDNKVHIRHNTLRSVVQHVNETCLNLNFGRGGFATYHLGRTIDGIAKFEIEPSGYS